MDDIVSYLAQDKYWVKAGRVPEEITISRMDADHRKKAAQWLLRKSPAMINIAETHANENIISNEPGATLADVLSLVAQDPRQWMRSRPLFVALVEGLSMTDVIEL